MSSKLKRTWPTGVVIRLFASALALAAMFKFSSGIAADDAAANAALEKPAPQHTSDLRAIEERVTSVAQKVLPATVALQVGQAQASGVIVTADGYVLTAAHVIGRPGRDVKITFPDGKTARGKTLGMTPEVDGGLVQITDDGPWPFAPIAARDEAPKPGDWCLATGHPGGFQSDRTPPVRLGRVIDSERAVIQTDCTISMGDSGGPLFDMQGRVIGIHSRIAEQTTMNLHVPAATYQAAWDVLKAGEIAKQPSRFLARFDTNGDGKIVRSEIPEGQLREVFDRMVGKLELDPEKPHAVDDLAKALGFSGQRGFDARILPMPTRLGRPGETLARERFAQGRAVRAAFGDVVAAARDSTVRVKCDGQDVALGTIVAANGWIVTKASQLSDSDKVVCVLADRRELPARRIHAEAGNDLAILRVDATELKAIALEQAPELRTGMWLASAGPSAEPLAVGVVSVAARPIARSPGVLGILIDDREEGPTVRQVMPASGAAAAGIKEGDHVTHIAKEAVHSMAELQAAVRKHRVGDVIKAAIQRDGKEMEFSVRLGMPEDSFNAIQGVGPGSRGAPGRESPDRNDGEPPDRAGRGTPATPSWRGTLSNRRDDFPAAIQHDTVLRPNDCGGPVLDVAGHVVGVNIARADRTGSYALPIATVRAMLDKLKSEASATDGNAGATK